MTAPAPLLPYVPGAIRSFLLADDAFKARVVERCSTRAPKDVLRPFAIVQTLPSEGGSVSGGVWRPIVQVTGWCGKEAGQTLQLDPEVVAWDIAVHAAALLSRARNVAYSNMHWSAEPYEGPIRLIDTTRGEATPLYGQGIRAFVKIHARPP